jgi:hypothetical protein
MKKLTKYTKNKKAGRSRKEHMKYTKSREKFKSSQMYG